MGEIGNQFERSGGGLGGRELGRLVGEVCAYLGIRYVGLVSGI